MSVFLLTILSVGHAGVREIEGPHADPCVQHGEGQSGWSPHMLLCTHQQEGQHLSLLARGVSQCMVTKQSLYPIHQASRGLTKLSWYLEGRIGKFVDAEGQRTYPPPTPKLPHKKQHSNYIVLKGV